MRVHSLEKRKETVAVARDCLSVASKVEKREGGMEGGGIREWII